MAIGPDGRYLFPAPEKLTFEPLPPDPRLAVPLPWWSAVRNSPNTGWASFVLMQLLLLVVFGLGRALVWCLRRRARGASLFLGILLFAVLGLGVWFFWLRFESKFAGRVSPFIVPWTLAVLGLPFLLFASRVVVWAIQGRWRRLGVLLAASVLVTFPMAGIMLWTDSKHLGPNQHYATDGWYTAWLVGAYVTGALLVLGWLLRTCFRALRRAWCWTFRRVRRVPAPATT